MSDNVDRAQALQELALRHAMANLPQTALSVTGRCHNCNEPLHGAALYCDDDCRHDHEQRQRAQRRVSA